MPNGEVIKRHPDTTIVVTTNNDYAGCKQMNQSVISRMNLVIDLEEPDEETLVQRVLGITGCTDKKTVRTMAQIIKAVSEYCSENLITDGCCGVRELISWCSPIWSVVMSGKQHITRSSLRYLQMQKAFGSGKRLSGFYSCSIGGLVH